MQLSWWEEFIVTAGISFLSTIAAKIKNPTELAALQAALAFLQKLAAGNVSTT